MLSVSSLSKTFHVQKRCVRALTDITVNLPRGSRMLLCGPNGSGKTTLLKCIAGLLCADSGTIEIGGTSYSADRVYWTSRLRRSVFYVDHRADTFYPQLSIRENLSFFSAPYIASPDEFRTESARYASALGIAELLDVAFQHISSGIARRVTLLRALLAQPEILLIDEWDSSLDDSTATQFLTMLEDFPWLGACILTTHYPDRVAEFCGSVLCVRSGNVQYSGSLEELRELTRAQTLQQAINSISGYTYATRS